MRRVLPTLATIMLASLAVASNGAAKEPPMHRDNVNTASASANGAVLLTGSTSGEVVWWGTAPFRPIRELVTGQSGEERGRIAALAVSHDGAHAAVAADWAPKIELWTLGGSPSVQALGAHGVRTTALAFSPKGPDGTLLATAGHDRGPSAVGDDTDDAVPPMLPATVRLWRGTALVSELAGPPGRVTALTFSPDGKRLSAGGDGEAREWDVATGRLAATEKTAGQVAAIVYVGDARCVVAAEGGSCSRGNERTELVGVRAPALAAAVTRTLVAGATYEALVVTQRRSGAPVAQLPGRAAAVLPVGDDLWAVFESNVVVLHDGEPSGVTHGLRALTP